MSMYSPSDFFIRLDFDGISSQFSDPVRIITARTVDEVIPALAEIEKATSQGLWAAGFIGYEAAPAFDAAFRVRTGGSLPLLCFGLFPRRTTPPDLANGNYSVSDWSTSTSAAEHAAGVGKIREAIAGGYTYQVNYTMRLQAGFDGDSYAFYRRLQRRSHAEYSAYINLGRHQILSVSPELFFHRQGAVITTRPMKGTVARGRWANEDNARRDWLAASEKNRAENVMIVDLLRNDLGRIAQTGTVKVDSLFDIERYPTVFQMTSTISADLKPGATLVDIFRALFPCGSVTGAPKISTMSLIADLENDPRGVYCGAIGYIAPGGDATFNVAIRTVVVDTETGTAEYGTGGGITWDSLAGDEYSEAAAKAAVLRDETPDFDLLETLVLRNGDYALLQRHIDRLLGSAAYFDMDVDESAIRLALTDFASAHSAAPYRVRLLVSQTGQVKVEGQPLGPSPSNVTVKFATAPVDSSDRFLYHKTTHRSVYEQRSAEHPDAFDVILTNERGEVTEFTIGNIVVDIDGRRYTPTIPSGVLPGTMRAELLEKGEIEERVLTSDEVRRASTVWLINSVRGWVLVSLIE